MLFFWSILYIYIFFLPYISQGAKRVVSEWVNLDSEARHFTSKFLGDGVDPEEPVESPKQSQDSATDNSLAEDTESKSEL